MQTDNDATTGGFTEAITTLLSALEHFLQWTSPERTARERAVWSAQLDNSGCCSRMWRSISRHWPRPRSLILRHIGSPFAPDKDQGAPLSLAQAA